jgi:transposase-like protein
MQMDRAAETAAYVNELRKSNLEHSTNLRKASLEIRKAEIANEAAVAKARQIRSTKAGKPKT